MMAKKALTEDTIIQLGKSIPLGAYETFFRETSGKELFPDFHVWLNTQVGKTIKDTLDSYYEAAVPKNMEQKLSEERFNNISDSNKKFIVAFNKAIEGLGYDYGGGIGDGHAWGKYQIVYGKTGTKSRPCAVRIYIKDNGAVQLRLFLNNVDKHRQYIENSPAHIKNVFSFVGGDCKSCSTMCAPGKVYTIDGQEMQKCNHSTFYFDMPTIEKLPDYMGLLEKFYPIKKSKVTK